MCNENETVHDASTETLQKNLGWQAYLEEGLLKSREVGSGILAEAQLLATRFAPKGELLTHGIPCLEIGEDQSSR